MPPRKKQKKEEQVVSTTEKPGNINSENRTQLESIYGVHIPDDVYQFWNLCVEFNQKHPLEALSCIEMKLVGPFEILAGKVDTESVKNVIEYHLHWRFYFDPPEMMTVIVAAGTNNLHHFGYLRDDPKDEDVIIVSNTGEDGRLNIVGDNIFAAAYSVVEQKMSTSKGKQAKNMKTLSDMIQKHAKICNLSLEARSRKVEARKKCIVTKTFHGAGIVIPIDENEVGYRPLHESDAKIKKMFSKIDEAATDEARMVAFDEIQEMITYIQFANDECDFGMGLELGIDMFSYGSRYLNKASNRLLTVAYGLLKRDLYTKIIERHLADRRKDNLSRLPEKKI